MVFSRLSHAVRLSNAIPPRLRAQLEELSLYRNAVRLYSLLLPGKVDRAKRTFRLVADGADGVAVLMADELMAKAVVVRSRR